MFILTSLSVTLTLFFCGCVSAQDKNTVVRLAKLKIDSTHLESYKAALKEEIEASVKAEPGVLSLYAVSEKDHPDQITIFEVYASEAAYISHRDTPHFKKYKSYTKDMVKSLELIDGVPILLGSKSK
jgi:quinol monooxygenase YgiN